MGTVKTLLQQGTMGTVKTLLQQGTIGTVKSFLFAGHKSEHLYTANMVDMRKYTSIVCKTPSKYSINLNTLCKMIIFLCKQCEKDTSEMPTVANEVTRYFLKYSL